jgi:hypothetical protein
LLYQLPTNSPFWQCNSFLLYAYNPVTFSWLVIVHIDALQNLFSLYAGIIEGNTDFHRKILNLICKVDIICITVFYLTTPCSVALHLKPSKLLIGP